ncbi:MAG: DUF2127 domain-containing protein [Planctomycetaceae bacterium]|nr:DUF2127 domain-containing protein [Planctomycetaceae bacterium]
MTPWKPWAYGLWYERRWAEWLGVITGGIYLPVELYELWKGANSFKVVALAVNLGIVAYLGLKLGRNPRHGGARNA